MTQGVLLDIGGVLTDGDTALPGAADAVARLRTAGHPLRFVTNSTRKPRRAVLKRLHSAGIDAAEDEVQAPAAAVHAWLAEAGYSPHLLIHPDLAEDFAGLPGDAPPAVVIGDAGRAFTYDALNAAFRLIADGAPFLALAANRVFRDDDGLLSLDAGPFVRALEYASGREARLFGKPAPGFFAAAADNMGVALRDLAMIGDDAEADVAGAVSAGLGTAILVRSGKYRPGDEDRFDPAPSFVADDVSAAVDRLLAEG